MIRRRNHPIWRVLAGLISVSVIALMPGILRGDMHAPDWDAVAGMALVLLLLPYVAITGRAPDRLERLLRLAE